MTRTISKLRTHVLLFLATTFSVFFAGAGYSGTLDVNAGVIAFLRSLGGGWRFAIPLLAILLCHEFGHYIAARIHRVPASLPYFIPAPMLSPFGTMGAVIAMPDRIRSRNALLDIGAAGPLCGIAVAIPVLLFGLATSRVEVLDGPYLQEGQSLLYLAMKRVVLGPIPAGSDVSLNATAFAGWVGLFVTAINLIPVSQLDGGHIAYALFGEAQDTYAIWLHRGLFVAFLFNVGKFVVPAVMHGTSVGTAIGNSIFYLFWFGLLALIRWRSGQNHPPTDAGELSSTRRLVAGGCLVLFVLLFMPTPWAELGG
ncbi:MAG: site-2 protease family protein [Polyangiaceae bacterium]